ncbi:hypothetical protein EVAR_31471_1 [Eumeta japonica]|uniref:Uncharacterized protein n=1 Tax=Eumeta variegata TaxID=151549 RepID=A0A4C1WA71_EUMVA|nr:hypothetical protein EVAR_31471_1 [Eumeta japonica]
MGLFCERNWRPLSENFVNVPTSVDFRHGRVGVGRLRKAYADRIVGMLKVGQILRERNRHARMKRLMEVSEARESHDRRYPGPVGGRGEARPTARSRVGVRRPVVVGATNSILRRKCMLLHPMVLRFQTYKDGEKLRRNVTDGGIGIESEIGSRIESRDQDGNEKSIGIKTEYATEIKIKSETGIEIRNSTGTRIVSGNKIVIEDRRDREYPVLEFKSLRYELGGHFISAKSAVSPASGPDHYPGSTFDFDFGPVLALDSAPSPAFIYDIALGHGIEIMFSSVDEHSLWKNRFKGCVRPLSLFYSDASADGVEKRSLVSRSRSHARLRRNAIMSHAFSCMQPAFIDL